MHKVAILVFENVVPLDFTVPLEIFSRAKDLNGKALYNVFLCGSQKRVRTHSFEMSVRYSLKQLSTADTIIVPASELPMPKLSDAVRLALRKAHARGIRIVSICGGAFYLAEAGLLDGRSATTHWFGTEDLKRRFPKVEVNPNVLYVDSGQILTSAGGCAGIDLCLHIVRKDFGAAVAAQSAKYIVMPLERAGGQAQFINHALPSANDGSLEPLLGWIEANISRELSIDILAKKSNMSIRTLNRQFKEQTGTTPVKWIAQARIRRARVLLETTRHSLEHVASTSGFRSPTTMREHFKNFLKSSPRAYRESFQSKADD